MGGSCLPLDLLSQTSQELLTSQVSVDGFAFFRLSYFDYSELQYLITNAENSVLKPPNLEIFCGRTETPPPPPTTRLVLSALAVVTPVTKTYLRP